MNGQKTMIYGLKVIKDSTTPKLTGSTIFFTACLKVIKDSTTPKHV